MKKEIITELRAVFHLATPLIFNLLSYMAMQVVDTIMLGRLGASALAASAIGNVTFVITLVGCLGILTAVGALAGQAFGDKNNSEVKSISQQSLWLCIFLSIPGMLILWNAHHFLFAIKQPFQVVLGAKEFLHGLIFGFFPCIGYIALREFTTAISRPKIVMLIAIAAIPLNALLTYWFMYGGLGLPLMHIFGVGLATAIVDWLMMISLTVYVATHNSEYCYNILKLAWPKFKVIRRILHLGFPVGISLIVEEFLFVMTAFLVGYFGITALAAHQIALQCMLIIVMVPIGISQAAAVRVSQLIGAGRSRHAFFSAYTAIGSGLVFAIIAASFLWLIPNFFVGLFIDSHIRANQVVVHLAAKLLIIIAIFHIIDAIQIITSGALRGYQDTLVPMFLSVISFWLAGIGSGYLFGFKYQYGVVGLWWGLAVGVTASAVFLQLRLLKHLNKSSIKTIS